MSGDLGADLKLLEPVRRRANDIPIRYELGTHFNLKKKGYSKSETTNNSNEMKRRRSIDKQFNTNDMREKINETTGTPNN